MRATRPDDARIPLQVVGPEQVQVHIPFVPDNLFEGRGCMSARKILTERGRNAEVDSLSQVKARETQKKTAML